MFRLQRFFSLASLATLLVGAVILGLFYRSLSIDLLLNSGENKNMAVARVLANDLWPHIDPLLQPVPNSQPKTELLLQEVLELIEGLKVVKVKIYAPSGLTVFSTDPAQIGEDQKTNPAIARALQGKVFNSFVERDSYNAFDGHQETQDLLQTYMPLYRPGSDRVVGIFELYSDYTPLLKRIQETQWWIMIGVGGVLSLLYGALQLIVRHADRIIKDQGRQLRESVVTLKQARDQLEERVTERTQALAARNQQLAKEVVDRKRMEQQIIHQEKMAAVGSLAAGIVHEIGNPLAALTGLLQSISTDAEGQQWPPTLQRDLALAQEQTQRLAGINRDVSEFATPEAEDREWVDFNNLVARSCRLMRYDSRLCTLELRLQLDTQLPALQLVGSQMVQVMMNLLSNAADALADHAAPEGILPQILVETFVEPNNVGFRVRDNGCGMTPETRAQATDAFYTTKPVGAGSGLGLSISHAIITAHRGTLIIESEPGQGTCVTVRLPLPDTDPTPIP